ncbi:MAG TPA: hypothetical protein VLF89_00060 [Candidatus Saccharimonadales bacterium]|nr:hypothetical protein [Candidatus Saccharimonadales bacterium]
MEDQPKDLAALNITLTSSNKHSSQLNERPLISGHIVSSQDTSDIRVSSEEIEIIEQKRMLEVVKGNTRFFWDENIQDTWCGYNKDDIVQRIATIARIQSIPVSEMEAITLYFGERIGVTEEKIIKINGGTSDDILIGECSIRDLYSIVSHADIILNRSREVAYNALHNGDSHWEKEKQKFIELGTLKEKSQEDDKEGLFCVLETPQEFLDWLLIEELNHAKFAFSMYTTTALETAREQYSKILNKQGKQSSEYYDVEIQEVVAGLMALRVLAELHPERKEYFLELREKALKTKQRVIPDLEKVFETVFIDS